MTRLLRRAAQIATDLRVRRAARSQTITAAAPAVATVVLQVASALAPAHATGFSISEVTFARLTIKGHVADAHTVVVVVS
jgi:hypothetical protein